MISAFCSLSLSSLCIIFYSVWHFGRLYYNVSLVCSILFPLLNAYLYPPLYSLSKLSNLQFPRSLALVIVFKCRSSSLFILLNFFRKNCFCHQESSPIHFQSFQPESLNFKSNGINNNNNNKKDEKQTVNCSKENKNKNNFSSNLTCLVAYNQACTFWSFYITYLILLQIVFRTVTGVAWPKTYWIACWYRYPSNYSNTCVYW